MIQVTLKAEEVLVGLWAWFNANPWFTKIDIKLADLTQELAAREAVLTLRHDPVLFHQLPKGVQGLAARLLFDFVVKLLGPMEGRVWEVTTTKPDDQEELTWLVIAQEIERWNPPPAERH